MNLIKANNSFVLTFPELLFLPLVSGKLQPLTGRKESRVTLVCLYRTSVRFYMLQLISVDSNTSSYQKGSWADVD